jgi:hypothetical protein
MAAFDLFEWGEQIADCAPASPALPNGLGEIETIGGGRYYARVLWDDDVAGGSVTRANPGCPSDPITGNTHSQTCVEIVVQP